MPHDIAESKGPTDPAGPTGRLATWVSQFELEQAPETVIERAKYLILDGLACALVGAHLPWSRRAVEAVLSVEGSGSSPIIGWGRTTSGPAACLLNGTFIQGFELDDYHPLAPLHSASLVIPSIVSTVHELGTVTGSQFLAAAIAGFEVGPRVGLGLHGGQMLSRGWHSGAVFGTHASAAASAVLRDLDAAQVEDALGLAATQSAGLMAAQYEAMSKRMHHGFSARNGYYAAALAAHGYTGIKRVYEREYGGFMATFGEGHDPQPDQVAADLGSRWHTEVIAFKAYAAMAGTHAAIDCMLRLREQGLGAEAVDRVEAWVSHAVYHHGWWPPVRPLETIGAQMNVGYSMAVALVDGAALAAQYTRERIDSDDVWNLLDRISVHHDETFDSRPNAGLFQTRVVVTTVDGSKLDVEVDGPTGGPGRPLSADAIRDKARSITADVIDAERWQTIESMVMRLDGMDDVTPLLEALARPVGSAGIEV
ncbi:MmgE/PrpD family protein [Nocardioidaceae bacterium Broad-1]|nr:MmgE/PrpD family protein [Nocardioidaceae bacterium Broad-1]